MDLEPVLEQVDTGVCFTFFFFYIFCFQLHVLD